MNGKFFGSKANFSFHLFHCPYDIFVEVMYQLKHSGNSTAYMKGRTRVLQNSYYYSDKDPEKSDFLMKMDGEACQYSKFDFLRYKTM